MLTAAVVEVEATAVTLGVVTVVAVREVTEVVVEGVVEEMVAAVVVVDVDLGRKWEW